MEVIEQTLIHDFGHYQLLVGPSINEQTGGGRVNTYKAYCKDYNVYEHEEVQLFEVFAYCKRGEALWEKMEDIKAGREPVQLLTAQRALPGQEPPRMN
jgi:hypothetical protein